MKHCVPKGLKAVAEKPGNCLLRYRVIAVFDRFKSCCKKWQAVCRPGVFPRASAVFLKTAGPNEVRPSPFGDSARENSRSAHGLPFFVSTSPQLKSTPAGRSKLQKEQQNLRAQPRFLRKKARYSVAAAAGEYRVSGFLIASADGFGTRQPKITLFS